jgi:wyosine [tRNA(Phe)-imidazoG37] synthetase (radical SAM superfamily)
MTAPPDFKYLYGPVPSWRLGRSLGVDLVSVQGKSCPFACIYCQLGPTTELTLLRRIFVPTAAVLEEIRALPPGVAMDYLTLSGRGEPTLAANLGEAIAGLKRLRPEKVAVLTNAALLDREEVRRELAEADLVCAKLDAATQEVFEAVNHPPPGLRIETVLSGIRAFRAGYRGRLALQIMFLEANREEAPELARLAREIGPDEVQLNTPLRPCGVLPLPPGELREIARLFEGIPAPSVYDAPERTAEPMSRGEALRRRGKRL